MRYHSEEEDRLYKIYKPYLEYDDRGCSYLPDTAPQEAKDAKQKVKEMIKKRKRENDLDGFKFEK